MNRKCLKRIQIALSLKQKTMQVQQLCTNAIKHAVCSDNYVVLAKGRPLDVPPNDVPGTPISGRNRPQVITAT